jgi:hypothetical protein
VSWAWVAGAAPEPGCVTGDKIRQFVAANRKLGVSPITGDVSVDGVGVVLL